MRWPSPRLPDPNHLCSKFVFSKNQAEAVSIVPAYLRLTPDQWVSHVEGLG